MAYSQPFNIWSFIQGVRRVVALTGAEARNAVTHAKELSEKLRELNDLSGPELEKHTTAFKVVKPIPGHQSALPIS